MIDKHFDGILSFCDYKLSLGFIEATNLKAKNIIRRAYGYQDKEYMKLKIIQACSSMGIFQPKDILVVQQFQLSPKKKKKQKEKITTTIL